LESGKDGYSLDNLLGPNFFNLFLNFVIKSYVEIRKPLIRHAPLVS